MTDNFYKYLNSVNNQDKDSFKYLRIYESFIEPLALAYPKSNALYFGQNKVEWLGFIDVYGFKICSLDGANTISYLKNLPENSQSFIYSLNTMQSFSFNGLTEFIKESHRVLKSGGLLILEEPTLNGAIYNNLSGVSMEQSELLRLMSQWLGFLRTKTLYMRPLYNVNRSYATISQKQADDLTLRLFDEAYDAKDIANNFNSIIDKTQAHANEAYIMASASNKQAIKAQEMAYEAWLFHHKIINSKAWKLLSRSRKLLNKITLRLAPYKPRRFLSDKKRAFNDYLTRHSSVKTFVFTILGISPKIKNKIIIQNFDVVADTQIDMIISKNTIPQEVKTIFEDLISQKQNNK